LNRQNNFVKILKIMSNVVKNFDILATKVRAFYIILFEITKLLF